MHVQPVPLPSGEPAAVLDGVARWITSAPLRDLVTAFGGQWPGGDSPTLLGWLDAFSATHWDFRDGAERPDAREPDFVPELNELIESSAEALGMVAAKPPPRRDYRHMLVLGGLAHACLRRTAYAAHLLNRGTAAEEVGVLGSLRPLSAAERALPAAEGCRSEFDVLDAGVRRAFKLDEPVEIDDAPDGSWSVRTYAPAGAPRVTVLAAPSSEPGVRRAHTADTQRFWAKRAPLAKGDRLLVVTAPIYVPFQHCDAVRTLGLPYGCAIDTVGVDPRLTDELPLPEPTLTPGRYLQEIRSAIRSMRLLVAALGG